MNLTLVMLAGAVVGSGILVAVWLIVQPTTSGPVALALLDARLARGRRETFLTADRRHAEESPKMRRVGARIAELLESQGVRLPARLDADLGMVGQSREMFFARTAGGALLGAVLPNAVLIPFAVGGLVGFAIPLWVILIGAVVGALVPYLELSRQARDRRRAFRHMVSAFLDLVAMNLAGGRGVPEALQAASSISDSWGLVRIRDALEAARLQGITPWAALGQLGEEVDVDELRDLSAALALVAEDGAKVRESLSARAASMRHRELADAEARSEERSQSMLVAQLLLCVGFLIFLIYPALARILA
ncbi:type II secretion system F family protein [Nocardioides bizhenqiangii]|uniref:Type II secretion system F family protein n=1 Tax=Nocardioides bizhenqiangii TaxID=3095076 RepID=A0ABZ0ZQ53_9ACTN|nr:type II secretion system F family protein [Nocardioides sp. HM61]WQQ25598.1 type II secretion system F family protein [Nocardioides sp. HM61]